MHQDQGRLLRRTSALALGFLDGVAARPVAPSVDPGALRAALGGPLPERGEAPLATIERLARDADPGLVASAGPRFFGFVTGGAHPAALAADWLTTAWDQLAALHVSSPAAAAVEEVAAAWLVELLGLGGRAKEIGVGFTTGCTMANFTALAAARHAVLRRVGWDVDADGLFGAPEVHVVVGGEAHVSILTALQMLGLGRNRVARAEADAEGRMRPEALRSVVAGCDGPTIVCAQAGNVNSGAFDPLEAIAEACRGHGAWLHVDGAFGLWAAASPALRHHLRGVALADSWATDAHKWLNVPYDSGLVLVADKRAHRAAMTNAADYYIPAAGAERDPHEWVPEASRRARGFAVYAVLRALGRQGVADLVDRCCALARRMADRLGAEPGIEILNQVVLNQVLARFTPGGGAAGDPAAGDRHTRSVIAAVQRDGTCWLGGTVWHGMAAMRISVSNWCTTESDIDRAADAVLACAAEVGGESER